jgi:hypothetical protein
MKTPLRVAAALVIGAASFAGAQQPQQQTDSTAAQIPAVGAMAPDFAFRAIDRNGIAANPTRLSDYRGQTVVLWFFIKARTRG